MGQKHPHSLTSGQRVDLWNWVRKLGGNVKRIPETCIQVAARWNEGGRGFFVTPKQIESACRHWGIKTLYSKEHGSARQRGYKALEEKVGEAMAAIVKLEARVGRLESALGDLTQGVGSVHDRVDVQFGGAKEEIARHRVRLEKLEKAEGQHIVQQGDLDDIDEGLKEVREILLEVVAKTCPSLLSKAAQAQ